MSLSIPVPLQSLSSAKSLLECPIGGQSETLAAKLAHLSLTSPGLMPFKSVPIRMGGGPRTYPGGVSKWQWKRMQAKKAKQLLKARLARERQIYEMRKRAELKAALSEIERPWEVVEKPPNLFSVSADEQLKVLADRFQKPGGLDLWSERDGPELFRPDNGLPSMRFFPKGVVHSVKPYGKTQKVTDEIEGSSLEEDSVPRPISGSVGEMGLQRMGYHKNSRGTNSSFVRGENMKGREFRRSLDGVTKEGENGSFKGKIKKKDSRRKHLGDLEGTNSGNARLNTRNDGRGRRPGSSTNLEFGWRKGEKMHSPVFEMCLQNDGAYGFESED